MWALHVNDALVFRGFELRQMGMNGGRFAGLRVHMEKRRVKQSDKKSRYYAAGRQLSHADIVKNRSFEVN
jgi:hypothetical protein